MVLRNLDKIDAVVESGLRAARIPGAGVAVVAGNETVFAKGYGFRDHASQLLATSKTLFPIASTSKAFNTTLLGMLVDEGKIAWDTPVQEYLPRFRLADPYVSGRVTIRDLVTMRTGLPRHDWIWMDHSVTRAELVERLRYLQPSADHRERFQYNNLTATTAGHIAEVITGESWEELIQRRILRPLGMEQTSFAVPSGGDTSLCYHENVERELVPTRRLVTKVTAPSGGSIHSNVLDMARWASFNLTGGRASGEDLITTRALAEIHSPQIIVGSDPTSPSPNATYAMGWFVDAYNGRKRVAHGGYLHDLNCDVSLFPDDNVGIVCYTNFGCPRLAGVLSQQVFDAVMGFAPAETIEYKLQQYEKKIKDNRVRRESIVRVNGAKPSHEYAAYGGRYSHRAYGTVVVTCEGPTLKFHVNSMVIPLQHWHYDVWTPQQTDIFPIHAPNPFDCASHFAFDTDIEGGIAGLSIPLEPAVAPIRFTKV